MLSIDHLTATYPSGKGIFDLNFTVKQGQTVGYLGPNGAGKTTTIRTLLGLMRPQQGTATIGGLDCFADASTIQKTLGYLAGEVVFLPSMTGSEYLTLLENLRGIHNTTLKNQLLDRFELSPKGSIQKYSKGMKQKLGLVAALMHDPATLILDEPTSGLDPLMQNRFVELMLEQKSAGKTILMSSHLFEEIERTCDQVLMIKDGRLVAQNTIAHLQSEKQTRFFIATPALDTAMTTLQSAGFGYQTVDNGLEIGVGSDRLDAFVRCIAGIPLTALVTKEQTLEELFLGLYQKEDAHE